MIKTLNFNGNVSPSMEATVAKKLKFLNDDYYLTINHETDMFELKLVFNDRKGDKRVVVERANTYMECLDKLKDSAKHIYNDAEYKNKFKKGMSKKHVRYSI